MLNRYEEFLKILDARILEYFNLHRRYICCKKSCSECCEIGEYPFSRLEAEYIMHGFISLPAEKQKQIKQNIQSLITLRKHNNNERFLYKCPFLIDKECSLYEYRGLVCRTHGLAYVSENIVHLPECVNSGLNYSDVYDPVKGEIGIDNPIKEDLRIDTLLKSNLTEEYKLECGEIRPLINWFM